METARTPKNGAHRLPAILRPHMVSIVRRGLINGGREPAACSRANLRPGPRSLLDRNAVEVVDPDAPDVAVVVLGSDVSNPMRSPPLDELAAQAHPRHLVDLPSEEDAGVETPPPHDALHPLTDHNYRLTVKVEADDEVIGPSVFRTAVPIRRNLDDEDEEVDVEIEDDVEAAMSVMFGESPERPARTSDAAIKHEPLSSPEASPALSETGSRASAPSRGDGTRPGWRNCPICDVAVMGVMGYRDHMLARHMRPQPYRCLACWKTFSLAKDLIRHTNNNCAVVMYKCQRCDRVWSSDVHHAACEACAAAAAAGSVGPEEDKDSVYECAACARTFPLLRHLMAHVKTHPDVAKPFKCHTCGLCFNASVRLMIHVRAHTLSPSKKSLARTRAPAPSPAAKRARNGAAGKAGAGGGGGATPRAPRPALAYPNPALAYANPAFILKMEPPEPHSDDEFADQAGPFNDDDYHDDIFKDAMGLDDDDDDDDAENWDEFDEDDDGSENQEAMLDEAMSVASPPGPASWKRFKCKLCPRTFRFSHQVGVHMRTHTRERPYSCRLCDATFRQSNHLKRHLYHNHGLAGPAAAQAFRSMIALKKRRLQRERFRALTAFFAKQGGFKGFGSSVEEAAEVNLLLDRGFDKDLSGHQNRAARKTPDDHFLTKPWIKLGHSARPNGVNGPAAPAAPAAAAPAPPPAPSPTSAPAPAANGRPVPPENGMPS